MHTNSSSHMDCNIVGSTSQWGQGPAKGFRSKRVRTKTGGKLLIQFKNNVPIGINASDFVSEIGLQVRNVAPVRDVWRWKEVPTDVRQVIKARVFGRSMKNIENQKRLSYNHCMGSKSFKAAMHALEKLVAEREKCTQEGAIQLTQEQISINVLGGRSGYLRGFGNGPKPTSTSRTTRTEQMKNNQLAMQRQMEEMIRLVARVTGSDMAT